MRCLIIGQGIAGTVLAWTLHRRGIEIQVADAGFPTTSSSIAAGIINPVTGKRFVKSWRFDDCYPFAKNVYHQMELAWGTSIWRDIPILRLLETPREINDWAARLSTPGYDQVMAESPSAGSWAGMLPPGLHFGITKNAARVNFPVLLEKFNGLARSEGFHRSERIGPDEAIKMTAQFDFIIFCEGYRAIENQLFPNLPWQLSKGEAILLELDHPDAIAVDQMLKKTLTLVPLGAGLFWAGASFNWTFEDNGPTEAEQRFLEQRLADMVDVPWKVKKRHGAIRPTVKDRRPFLGASPVHPQIYIFNGLGTKGGLLAPFWASHLADHLLEGKPLDKEVDIRRFYS
ncbi:MAG: FAD-binding oxidoreductase [Lewinellaceae bacterium]|nr:FAD-binding oxidoreductase [Saprospiraceae bacterium]MCB9330373.1 FAD-binding oxidoreductase [Lewinellaceae bacterium]